MDQPKWFHFDRDLKEGDIVLFLKLEKELCSNYQYGIVHSIEQGRDGKVRQVQIRYRNSNERIDRFTSRAARSLIVIHPADETNLTQELGQIAIEVEIERRNSLCKK